MMKKFIGRQIELQKLKDLTLRRIASLVVITGRRRIGKSYLVAEFAKDKKFLSFTGLAPEEGMTDQNQRDAFAQQLSAQLKIPAATFLNWSDAFTYLSHHLDSQPTVILLDEISWMGSKDPTFVPKLKAWWDLDVQNRSNVTLAFCGSVSTWIEENIINSTSFFGRISLMLELAPLTLQESVLMLRNQGVKASPFDLYKILAVTGGIPWYLEQILSHYTIDQNMQRLCFEKKGILTTEFDRIFHDLYSQKGTIYKSILTHLRDGMKTLAELRDLLKYPQSGTLSHLLDHLITSGFVTKHAQWSIKTGKERKQSLYRLNDPYVRFYLKYIEPNLSKINKNTYRGINLTSLPGYDSMMGYQLECLLLQNRGDILRSIGLNPLDCVYDNPYFQKGTTRQKGCQIDYLIQTRTNNLYICEFKFKRQELRAEIISEVSEKIKNLDYPKGFATVPVLFNIGGVVEDVIDQQYFYRIIDLADLLGE